MKTDNDDIVLVDAKNETEKPEEKKTDINDDFFSKYSRIDTPLLNPQPTEKESSHPHNEQPINEPEQKERKPRATKKKYFKGQYLSGALFLVMCDMIVPIAISLLNDLFDGKNKVRVLDLQLTPEQKQTLTPIADEAMKELEITSNPLIVLGLVSIGMYGSNFMEAKMGIKNE